MVEHLEIQNTLELIEKIQHLNSIAGTSCNELLQTVQSMIEKIRKNNSLIESLVEEMKNNQAVIEDYQKKNRINYIVDEEGFTSLKQKKDALNN